MENTFGAQLQTSWIDLGLYQTVDRVRTNKVDYAGDVIPATTKVDAVTETSGGLYYDNRIWWADKFRSEFGLREDIYNVDVRDLDPVNSGDRSPPWRARS
jgi:outer membrane receptor protein involved in Fe transport